MKFLRLMFFMTMVTGVYATEKLSRELCAYNYHSELLKSAWLGDRFLRPIYYAALWSATIWVLSTYAASRLDDFEDNSQTACLLGFGAGLFSFVSSSISLILLKGLWRVIKKNPQEGVLEQSLAFISDRLKASIADGQVTLVDLERCFSQHPCPLERELIEYAIALNNRMREDF